MNTLEIITAISTAASAIFAAWVLWETKKYRRPYIVVRLVNSNAPNYSLEIINIGGGTAYDISIRFNQTIFANPEYLDYFDRIPFLESGGTLRYGLDLIEKSDLIRMIKIKAKCTWFASPARFFRIPIRRSVLFLNPLTLPQTLIVGGKRESQFYKYKRTLRGWVTRTRI